MGLNTHLLPHFGEVRDVRNDHELSGVEVHVLPLHVRLHDMRHQAATVLLNNRISPHVVAERLGHSRTSTTLDVYAQFLPPADQEAADILGALLT